MLDQSEEKTLPQRSGPYVLAFCAPPLTRKNTISVYDLSRIFKTPSLSLLPLRAPKNAILRHTPPSPAQPPGRVLVLNAVITGTIAGLATALLMVNRGNNDNDINSTKIGHSVDRPIPRPTPSTTDGDYDWFEDGNIYVDLPPFSMVLEPWGGDDCDHGDGDGRISADGLIDVTIHTSTTS